MCQVVYYLIFSLIAVVNINSTSSQVCPMWRLFSSYVLDGQCTRLFVWVPGEEITPSVL